ncbi:MAG: phosphoribosylanthranilate isomerase [Agarilytica sp.]
MPTRVKICGITREQDADFAAAAGADAIGLVFYPPSSRFVSDLVMARDIALAAGPLVTVVGLFVDAEPQEVDKVLATVPLNLMQFHGGEQNTECERFGRPFIKALRMKDKLDVDAVMASYPSASGFLLDTYVSGSPGGTGQVFDWERVPSLPVKPIILAGGLDENNVHKAVQVASPYGVDVSGGVEAQPGIKSHEKINAFIKRAKEETHE